MGHPVDTSATRGRALIQPIGAYLRLFIRRLNKYHGAWERSLKNRSSRRSSISGIETSLSRETKQHAGLASPCASITPSRSWSRSTEWYLQWRANYYKFTIASGYLPAKTRLVLNPCAGPYLLQLDRNSLDSVHLEFFLADLSRLSTDVKKNRPFHRY